MNTELVKSNETRTEGSSKRARDELESDNSKKQKIDEYVEAEKNDDQEEADMKKHIEIVKDDEVAIDAIPLATKPPVIVKYKIVKEGKEQQQSSSVSSDFTSKLLNFENPSPADNEIASLLETSAHHAIAIPEITSGFTTTTLSPTPFFNPLVQQQTPTFTTTTSTNPIVTLPEIPNFAYVFKFDQRVSALESKISSGCGCSTANKQAQRRSSSQESRISQSDRLDGNGYSLKDQNKAKTDKTEHGNGKERDKSKSTKKSKSKSTKKSTKSKSKTKLISKKC
ncbi:hypothetical protein Tco_1476400 [Tanacetum coccineum]